MSDRTKNQKLIDILSDFELNPVATEDYGKAYIALPSLLAIDMVNVVTLYLKLMQYTRYNPINNINPQLTEPESSYMGLYKLKGVSTDNQFFLPAVTDYSYAYCLPISYTLPKLIAYSANYVGLQDGGKLAVICEETETGNRIYYQEHDIYSGQNQFVGSFNLNYATEPTYQPSFTFRLAPLENPSGIGYLFFTI